MNKKSEFNRSNLPNIRMFIKKLSKKLTILNKCIKNWNLKYAIYRPKNWLEAELHHQIQLIWSAYKTPLSDNRSINLTFELNNYS